MIIDFRVRPPYKSYLDFHLYRPASPPKDPKKISALAMGKRPIPSVIERSIGLFIKEMDEVGIGQAVVMGRNSPEPWGAINNDDIKDLIDTYPGRFFGFAGISLADIGKAVAQVEYWLGVEGFKGIAMDTQWENPPLYPSDDKIFPVYSKCQELGGICSITSSIAMGPDMSYSEPIHIQRVAVNFPDMPIVVPHACWPHIEGILGVAQRCANLYLIPDFYGHIPNMPMADQIVRATNFYLRHRLLYVSSFPVRGLQQSVEEFKNLDLEPDVMENCLRHNAADLLGIE